MLFQTKAGEGVNVERTDKRMPALMDPDRRRLIRGHTWQTYRDQGYSVPRIAEIFQFAASTVHADLAALRAARDACGRGGEGV